MRISNDCNKHNFEYGSTYKLWTEAAQKVSLKTGICVTVNMNFPNPTHSYSMEGLVGSDRIYFKV